MEYILYLIVAALIVAPVYLVTVMFRIKQAQRRLEWLSAQKFTTLRIDVPKNNDKMPLAAEQMFASIHGIYSESALYQNHLSFEIVAKDKFIQFYVHVPVHVKDFVEGQIYAQYPTVEIKEVEDYAQTVRPHNFAECELLMNKPDVYPIKFFDSFEVDPLSGITSVMSKLAASEEVWLQFLIRPVGDDWQEKGNGIVSAVRSGKKPGSSGIFSMIKGGLKGFLRALFMQIVNPGGELTPEKSSEVKLPSTVEEALKGIEQKITKLGFETKIRILSIADDSITAGVRCQSIAAAFKQFNTTNLNGFKIGEIHKNNFDLWQAFVMREFIEKGNILNITELASIYHLPNQTVSTPNIVWSGAKKGEPPANLPLSENVPAGELTIIGMSNFRNAYREFGIKRDDRRRHIYIVGKSGTGKSTLIENMAIDDVVQGKGVIVVDPHGELADKVLSCVPDERISDVIVFDPSDRAYPVGFNLLEQVDDDFKGMVASGFVGIFKKIFGDSWGPRLEHILRNTVLALLDSPDSTMLDIPRMLTDNRFRDKAVEQVKDPVIREFWVNEFAQYDAKFRTEAVSPILNKVGQFLATATIRNIVGQPNSRINIRQIMDQEKILIVNLSRGKIGEDNSALLGAMMITKIQLAAMSRADVPADQRPDTYLYVDEFQNFATDSFAVILSEARKYNLCLTMANQYIEQMHEEVRSAVFGNAGTIITFRVGGTDASFLVKEYEPVFDANDLVNLERYTIYIKLLIEGIAPPAFSAKTLPPVQRLTGNTEKIVNYSREHYSSPRAYVEGQIGNRAKQEEDELRAEAEAFRQGGLEALLLRNKNNNGSTSGSEKVFTAERPPVSKPIIYSAGEQDQSSKQPSNQSSSQPNIQPNIQLNNQPDNQPGDASVANKSLDQENQARAGESSPGLTGQNFSQTSLENDQEKKNAKPRVLKYQNIIADKIYKEQTARGGVKWYVGEEIDLEKSKEMGIEVTEEALKMIELNKKAFRHQIKTSSAVTDQKTHESKNQQEKQVVQPKHDSAVTNTEQVKNTDKKEEKSIEETALKDKQEESKVIEEKNLAQIETEKKAENEDKKSETKPEETFEEKATNEEEQDSKPEVINKSEQGSGGFVSYDPPVARKIHESDIDVKKSSAEKSEDTTDDQIEDRIEENVIEENISKEIKDENVVGLKNIPEHGLVQQLKISSDQEVDKNKADDKNGGLAQHAQQVKSGHLEEGQPIKLSSD